MTPQISHVLCLAQQPELQRPNTKNARGQTIIFAPSIEEGKNVTALLNSQHGASTAAFIDGTTQNRGHFLEAYRLGLIKVLVCYAVLTEGVDLPRRRPLCWLVQLHGQMLAYMHRWWAAACSL